MGTLSHSCWSKQIALSGQSRVRSLVHLDEPPTHRELERQLRILKNRHPRLVTQSYLFCHAVRAICFAMGDLASLSIRL